MIPNDERTAEPDSSAFLAGGQRGERICAFDRSQNPVRSASYRRSEQEERDERSRVLVADGDADTRQYLIQLLAEHYRVEAVADGEAALIAVRKQPPDLILTDAMMPRLDGFGLLRKLRADAETSSLPVILLSAQAGEESRVAGMQAGADDYLVKPFSAQELLARVSAHLQMARLRREAGASLRQSEERLRMALTAARMVAWQWELSEDRVLFSENAAEVFGLPLGSSLATIEQALALIHPEDVERHRATIRKAAAECGNYFSQFRMVRPDNGQVIWLEERGHGIGDVSGKSVRLVGVALDVTVRKLAEEQLAAELAATMRLHALSTRLLSADNLSTALADVLENAIATCSADFGNIQLYNPQTKALEMVVHRGFPQEFLDYFRTVRLDDGSACAQAMLSGERIFVEDVELDPGFTPHRRIAAAAGFRAVQSTPLKTHDGAIVGMLSTHFRAPHRVSDRDQRLLDLYARHAADLIERLRFEQALKDADRRKDEFLATLAHELRNPLAPLRNGLQVMKLTRSNAESMEQVRAMMERQLTQLVRLVDDLMDVSRITRGKITLRKERVELAGVVQQAVETSRPVIEASGHELTIHVSPQPIFVEADVIRLAQVIANLLNNAAKYTERDGQITLVVQRQEREAVVSVRDTGVGIPAHMLPRVFDLFTQVDRSLERSQGGLGIGLTLVKRLVEMHGGSIEAHSDGHGRGSEFVVRLPVVLTLAEEQQAEGGAAASSVARRRILVVDDNRDAALSLAMILQMMGNETQTAHDGLEAIDVAAAFRPDVILLDIGMPKLNGYDTCRRIRAQPWGKHVMIVALTGWGQDEDKRRSQEAGFTCHLVKPVEPAALEALLAERKIATA
jgi:PAS domain S-box-containing protein